MHTLHLLVFFSGVWAVQASCGWNLSVEPICRPSALQRLLVCSVHCAAMLRHHEWKCLIRPSGNYVLPAHKVQWNVEESTCLWVFLFFLRPPIDFPPPLSRPVSLSVVPLHTLFWAWPSWCPILLSDCSTYASSTWEAMQLFRMKTSCTGEIIAQLMCHRFTPLCPIICLILSHNSFVHVLEGNSHIKNPKAKLRTKLKTEQGEFWGEFLIIFWDGMVRREVAPNLGVTEWPTFPRNAGFLSRFPPFADITTRVLVPV